MKRLWSDSFIGVKDLKVTKILAVLGPTASGKSGLAEDLALRADGELVNSDASAVYRELSVGVTKPSHEEQMRVPHHCLDLVGLEEGFDLAHYLESASAAIGYIASRGKLPIVVGGSNLYTRALLDGYRPPQVEVPEQMRREIRSLSQDEALQRLWKVDPQSYQRIDRQNPRRVARALELASALGGPCPPPKVQAREDWKVLKFLLAPRREVVKDRIAKRCLAMWDGWVKEVDHLEKNGLTRWLELRKPIGYSWVLSSLKGEIAPEEAREMIIRQTIKLAKKQQTWLKKEAEGAFCIRFHLDCEEDWSALPDRAWRKLNEFLGTG